jgi:hypothetical protein
MTKVRIQLGSAAAIADLGAGFGTMTISKVTPGSRS